MELLAVDRRARARAGRPIPTRQPDETIGRYLRAARRAKALLILDIQPGRSDFFTETVRLRDGSSSPTSGSRSTPSGGCGRARCRER